MRTPRASEEGRHVFLLEPDPTSRIFVVDSPDDYKALVTAYPQHYENAARGACPHWARLAMESTLDAIHVTTKAARDPRCVCAATWEVESTLWFHPAFHLVT
jgi:hypothetical protein